MPREGPRRLPAGERDRRLAEEVLYLHSLWRRGGPAPAPAPAPIQPRSDRREEHESLRGRLDLALRSKEDKRRKIDHAAAAAPVLVPLPPAYSRETLAEAAGASAASTANPPGPLAQREAVPSSRLEFSNLDFADHDDGGPDSERDKEEEEAAARHFTGLFQRDALLRGHYTRRWRKGRFPCLVCAPGGGTGKAVRHFRGCLPLVQHACNSPRSRGRHGAHRALAAVVCRLLGWHIETLVRRRIVIGPRATAGVQHSQENDVAGDSTDDESYSIDGDEESDDEESVDEEEDIETGIRDPATDGDEEDSEIENDEEYAEKEDADTGAEGSKITDGDKEAIMLDNSEKPEKRAANSIARKRDMKIRDHLLSLTHAKLVGTPPKKTDVRKRSCVMEVSTPGSKFYEGSGKAKRKASALSYQGQSSTSGVVKKVKVSQQPSNKGKLSNKTNETGTSARKAKRPAVAARKAKQLSKKQFAKKKLAKAARKAKQLAKKQRAKKRQGGFLNS